MRNPLAIIGQIFLASLAEIGSLSRFAGSALSHIVRPPVYWRLILRQMWLIGYNSLPVVGLTALFTGAALAQQIYVGGSRFNAASVVPGVVVVQEANRRPLYDRKHVRNEALILLVHRDG